MLAASNVVKAKLGCHCLVELDDGELVRLREHDSSMRVVTRRLIGTKVPISRDFRPYKEDQFVVDTVRVDLVNGEMYAT